MGDRQRSPCTIKVDEKAVSDLVGSLESQLAGQSNSAGKADENGGAGSVAPANHHLGKTLPAPVSATTLEQQQQPGRRIKPEMRQEVNSKDDSPDKTVTSPSLGCSASFGEAPTTPTAGVSATSSGIQSHGASITPLTASGVSTLASPQDSISTASSRSSKVSPGTGEAPTEASAPRKRVATPRRSPSARIKSLNGAAVTTRRSSITAVTDGIISSVDPGATLPNSTRSSTSSINTSTFTLSNANLPVGQSAIVLDRGTPTIALHRLPNHIVASIAQNGNGTSVSALVQQGTPQEPATASSPTGDLSKAATDTGASKTDDCPSNIVTQSQVGGVSSVINTVSPSASCAITPATSTTAAPTTTTTTTVTQPLSSTTTAACPTAMATISFCGTVQTTSVTTTMSMVRPTAPSPTPTVATPAQPQPRPGLATPQRIVAPQLIVRPSQQQTTIQLPPGFTIPPGKVFMEGRFLLVIQYVYVNVTGKLFMYKLCPPQLLSTEVKMYNYCCCSITPQKVKSNF
ncbi:hypothetical protein XENOCAPTIV_028025 [Xenoophorus captivus]|uniref:Uncharacterized protein n=1 Tax=Xenoophorus captivus TaxID=1517983 RepID=A0ABV0QG15_9TELE